MRVLVMVKATKESEAGVMPTQQLLTDMGNSTKNWSKPESWRPARACIPRPKARA